MLSAKNDDDNEQQMMNFNNSDDQYAYQLILEVYDGKWKRNLHEMA